MLNRFRALFTPKEEDSDAVHADRVRVATCVLLLEIAYADRDFSDEECERIREILRDRFELTPEEVDELLEVAEAARQDSHDLWRFTNQINQSCTPTDKQQIIEEVWRVVYTDGHLSSHEDHLIHRMATLLNLTHRQLIDAKMRVLDEIRNSG